jgi:hypothetical protein
VHGRWNCDADSRRLAALHAALRFVITNDTGAELKPILIDVLTQALRTTRPLSCSSAHSRWHAVVAAA